MVNTETTKRMQEALQTAVTRMNNGSAEPQAGPTDTIGAIISALPKLLRSNESSEELLEKLDALQKADLTPLREQMQILRKQFHRMLKFQEQLLVKMDEMLSQQSAVGHVVLDLTRQMARIRFIEDDPTDDDDYEQEAPPARESYRRPESRMNGEGRGRSQRET